MEQVLSTIVNNGLKAGWTALGHKEGEGPVREGQVSKISVESGGQVPGVSAEWRQKAWVWLWRLLRVEDEGVIDLFRKKNT